MPDTVLEDPLAIDLVERIDYPFAERFGPTARRRRAGQALRVARASTRRSGASCACAPGRHGRRARRGLETAFQRTDERRSCAGSASTCRSSVRGARGAAAATRVRATARSRVLGARRVLDRTRSTPTAGVLITAQAARCMYLEEPDVHGLLGACASMLPLRRLRSSTPRRIVFTALALRGALQTPGCFVAPPMPCGHAVAAARSPVDRGTRGARRAPAPAAAAATSGAPSPRSTRGSRSSAAGG